MNEPDDPERPGRSLDAALFAAFGPASTAVPHGRPGVLDEFFDSIGGTSRILLREEPDAPAPVVGPLPAGEAAPGGRGRYHVLGEIARGGMGVVLKGRDPDLGRDVALKVLHPGHAGNPAMIQRFIEEAQVGGQLQHPGILPVYELGLDADRRPFFTMRLVKGRTLAELLDERPGPAHDLGRLLAVFEQVCQTVAYAHARGVIHRDLKPSNIMVGAFGEVQVVDWGLSKVLGQGTRGDDARGPSAASDEPQVATLRSGGDGRAAVGAARSQSGSVIGTPPYMGPEQARGEIDDLDEQADVFALGAILCEIMTGRPPYTGDRAKILDDAANARLDEAFARLDASGAERDLVALAKRCLDPSRGVRPRHAGVLAREVAAFLASVGDRARRAEIAAAEARATAAAERKARWRTVALAATISAAIVACVGLVIASEHARRARAVRHLADLVALHRKADWFLDQARHIPPDQLGPWERVLGHVRATAEVIARGAADADAVDPDARQNLARLLDELKIEERRVRDRARMYRLQQKSSSPDR